MGSLLGFRFKENFRYPYISQSTSEFWRRWHISLGSWFKEYVYIPLGGSRAGKWKLIGHLFSVWFLTGIWHGESWNFVLWGLFFAGCPLRCQWCSNPESFYNNRISYYEKTCIKCGRCVQVCPYQAALNLNDPLEWEKCRSCGLCAEVCPTGSRKKLIHHYTSEEILKLIEKQKIFYRYSGGGVTFSGGEAMLQQDLLRKLVYSLYDQAVNLAIETSGCFDFDEVKDILEKMDLIFVDIKHMDRDKHKFYTGISNERILKNIAGFNELKVPVVVRIPVIDGVNSDIENIRATAQFAKVNLDTPKIELLPYHSLGDGKYEALGLEKPSRSFKTPSRKHLMELCRIVEHEGVEVVSYK